MPQRCKTVIDPEPGAQWTTDCSHISIFRHILILILEESSEFKSVFFKVADTGLTKS